MRRTVLSAVIGLLAWSAGVPVGAAATAAIGHAPRHALTGLAPIHNFGWSSSNWSGYAIAGSGFSSITGKWTVNTVTKTTKSTYSSSWIGIDGFNNANLIQTGTEADWTGGHAVYRAWWEILPSPETVITSMTIHPGDVMTASIRKGSATSWTITLTDTTTGKSFTTSQIYAGPQTSAEWIQEAPTVGGRQANLAHYGKVTFDPGTVNGASPGLVVAEGGTMVQGGKTVSTPSNPDSDTDGFNAAYGAVSPSPPTS